MISYFLFVFSLNLLSPIRAVPLAPAFYVFGDSLFDTGNNDLLPTLAKVNYLPYGDDFPTGPTGRFTDGRNVADFIAEYLGLPYPPPYMSLQGRLSLSGINFASGACGILLETGKLTGECMSLKEQIDAFERIIEYDLSKRMDASQLSEHLSKSIFAISIGSNDYINNYLEPLYVLSKGFEPQPFAKLLNDNFSLLLQRLYKLGARKIVTFDVGPVGCTPFISGKHPHPGDCDEEANQVVSYYNQMLPATLNNLTSSLPGSKFALGHANTLATEAIKNPSKFGLVDVRNPCCIAAANLLCVPLTIPCQNRGEHLFWDGVHLTEAAYSGLASRFIRDKSSCTPMTIQELVKM